MVCTVFARPIRPDITNPPELVSPEAIYSFLVSAHAPTESDLVHSSPVNSAASEPKLFFKLPSCIRNGRVLRACPNHAAALQVVHSGGDYI
jgi:hypothetical protein